MTPLDRPRDVGELLRDALTVYLRHFWTFLALAAVVVVPAELIVSGVGLEMLTSDFDSTTSLAEEAAPGAVSYLVVAPLITAFCVFALTSIAGGGSPGAREAIVKGFESFTPIFFAVLLAALGIVLGLILIVPGIYLFVRWFFVPQVVVLEQTHQADALRSSSRLVQGAWWRTAGVVLLVTALTFLVSVVVASPFAAAARSTDHAVWALAGQTLAAVVAQPFASLCWTLLYFDLRARKRAAHT